MAAARSGEGEGGSSRSPALPKLEYKEGLICKYETAGQVLATMRMLISGHLCGLRAGVWACERLEALGSRVAFGRSAGGVGAVLEHASGTAV